MSHSTSPAVSPSIWFSALVLFAAASLAPAPNALAESVDVRRADVPLDAVNLMSAPYAYEDKERFLAAVEDRLKFFNAAIANWKSVPATAKDEAKAYAARGLEDIQPRVAKAKESFGRARSSGASSWTTAQAESRRDLLDLQRAYYALHGNVTK